MSPLGEPISLTLLPELECHWDYSGSLHRGFKLRPRSRPHHSVFVPVRSAAWCSVEDGPRAGSDFRSADRAAGIAIASAANQRGTARRRLAAARQVADRFQSPFCKRRVAAQSKGVMRSRRRLSSVSVTGKRRASGPRNRARPFASTNCHACPSLPRGSCTSIGRVFEQGSLANRSWRHPFIRVAQIRPGPQGTPNAVQPLEGCAARSGEGADPRGWRCAPTPCGIGATPSALLAVGTAWSCRDSAEGGAECPKAPSRVRAAMRCRSSSCVWARSIEARMPKLQRGQPQGPPLHSPNEALWRRRREPNVARRGNHLQRLGTQPRLPRCIVRAGLVPSHAPSEHKCPSCSAGGNKGSPSVSDNAAVKRADVQRLQCCSRREQRGDQGVVWRWKRKASTASALARRARSNHCASAPRPASRNALATAGHHGRSQREHEQSSGRRLCGGVQEGHRIAPECSQQGLARWSSPSALTTHNDRDLPARPTRRYRELPLRLGHTAIHGRLPRAGAGASCPRSSDSPRDLRRAWRFAVPP